MKEQEIILPSNPRDLENIKKVIDDIILLMQKKAIVTEDIKMQIEGLAETYEIPVKFVRKMATTAYKDNYQVLSKENETFELAFETIFKESI